MIIEHILKSFPDTAKPAGGYLKHPYITPGGPYAHDQWDWDSYWTMYAICGLYGQLGRTEELGSIRDYARGTFFNFLESQGEDGALPILISENSGDYFGCLHKPENNMAKPFIGQMCNLLLENGLLSKEEAASSLSHLQAFHHCYDTRYLDKRTGLVFWANDWGIGMDDDPACWGRPYKSCGSVFLNAFLLKDCQSAREVAVSCGDTAMAEWYTSMISRLFDAIEHYCWDSREKAYFSVDLQCRQQVEELPILGQININLDAFWHCLKLKILTWYSFLPFWVGLGTQEQLDACIRENLVGERLLSPFGVRTISRDESMYQPEVSRGNPSNWLGPIWVLPNYIIWDTLRRRHHPEEARSLATSICHLLENDLKECGQFHECYSPETGKGICYAGFMSWNALAGIMSLCH